MIHLNLSASAITILLLVFSELVYGSPTTTEIYSVPLPQSLPSHVALDNSFAFTIPGTDLMLQMTQKITRGLYRPCFSAAHGSCP